MDKDSAYTQKTEFLIMSFNYKVMILTIFLCALQNQIIKCNTIEDTCQRNTFLNAIRLICYLNDV